MAETEIIHFHGQEIWLHGAKLLWVPAGKLLCAADMHLEKGSFFSRFATLLPPYDTGETLRQLEYWVDHFQPEIFVALGDSFHDGSAVSRLETRDKGHLLRLVSGVERWIWIAGNHDVFIDGAIPGERRVEFEYEGIYFRHEFANADHPQIIGHFHPKAGITVQGRRISAPCFLLDGEKLILPSFGTFTGGLNADSAELAKLMPQASRRIYLAHKGEIYRF